MSYYGNDKIYKTGEKNMKKLHFILMGALATSLLGISSVSATESVQQQNDKTVFTQEQDRIELFSDTVILNVGQEFKPELYAKAYRNGEEIPYDGHEFVAIQQEVDTSKPGEYPVVYRLHNGPAGTHIDQYMTVVVKEKISDDGVVENDKPSTDFDKDDVKKPISKPGTTVTTNKTNKQSSNQVLPKTGETNTIHLMRLSGVTLMSGLYVLNKRKIK